MTAIELAARQLRVPSPDDLDVPDNLFLGREKTICNWLGPSPILDFVVNLLQCGHVTAV